MAIESGIAKMLLNARMQGVDFSHTLMIGPQNLVLWENEVAELGKTVAKPDISLCADYQFGSYADTFFHEILGAKSVQSMDYSSYEGATIVHDMNYEIPEELFNAFSVVIDGGTLEHVFNFPIAIKNCMQMVRKGGTLFIFTGTNNYCGHGFYQVSPELFFRLLNNVNGFHLQHMIGMVAPDGELSRKRSFFSIPDPADIGKRVGLITKSPVLLLIQARKEQNVSLIATYPQQSDYESIWASSNSSVDSERYKRKRKAWLSIGRFFYQFLPQPIQRRIMGYYIRYLLSFKNSLIYKKIKISWRSISVID